ncbi:uncharacterized protein LOC117650520 [Thrips palmi]|uniref:Uncharacterized protein LOC117650520 n=1 Tax=Thrips palmi TaxID=161013 RepID=A0A6P8ZXP7_THRPL|nr:uncharacterized protein LOC117650520 [Thrips palmi]
MNFQLLSVFALVCLAAVLVHAEEEEQPHLLVKRSGNSWFKNPGSPTSRRTVKDGVGQQVDYTQNENTGHQTNGYLAKGKNARDSSPIRSGQPHSGGEAGTSQKKGKKKGH